MSKAVLPIVIIFIAVVFAFQILQSKPDASTGHPRDVPLLAVESSLVKPQNFLVFISSFGTVQSTRRGEVHSLVSGQIQALSPSFKAGGHVSKGEVLLELDPSEYTVALQLAMSDLANAELALAEEEARSEQAQRDWRKQKDSVPSNNFALRIPHLKAAKARLSTAAAQLDLAELNLERTKVKSSYNGRIQQTYFDLGAVVSPSNKLADGYASDSVEVRLAIASKDMAFIQFPERQESAAERPEVFFSNNLPHPSEQWLGHLIRTEAAIDEISQQLYVVAEIKDPFVTKSKVNSVLKIGQYLEASIQGKHLGDVIVVPNRAIYQGAYVYVVEGGKISRRPIQVSWSDQQQSIVTEGLLAGDHLVMTLLGQVSTGTLVSETLLSSDTQLSEDRFYPGNTLFPDGALLPEQPASGIDKASSL